MKEKMEKRQYRGRMLQMEYGEVMQGELSDQSECLSKGSTTIHVTMELSSAYIVSS